MLQRQSKNNDLVIQVEGAGIRKLEYYTDGEYKYVTDYISETVYIPSSELKKMNDGQLNSTIYIGVDNDNFSDGTQDRVVNQTFSIWIGSESTSPNVNEYYTKDEIDSMLGNGVDLKGYYTKEEIDAKIPTDYISEIPSEYITEDELNSKGYLTQHQDLSEYAKKSEIPTDYLKEIPAEYITESELNDKGYITNIKTVKGQSLIGEGDIEIDYSAGTGIKIEDGEISLRTVSSTRNNQAILNAIKSNGQTTMFRLTGDNTISITADGNYANIGVNTTNLATKDELYDDTALSNRVTAVETSLQGIESILQEING